MLGPHHSSRPIKLRDALVYYDGGQGKAHISNTKQLLFPWKIEERILRRIFLGKRKDKLADLHYSSLGLKLPSGTMKARRETTDLEAKARSDIFG